MDILGLQRTRRADGYTHPRGPGPGPPVAAGAPSAQPFVKDGLAQGTRRHAKLAFDQFTQSRAVLITDLRRDLYSLQDRLSLQAIYRDSSPVWRTDWALAVATEKLEVRDVHVTIHTLAGAFLSDTRNAVSDTHRRVHSATLELNSRLGRNWRAVYGGRVDDYSDVGQQMSPRLGLVYQPGDNGAPKLLYGQAFRAPSAAERNGTANTVLGNPDLKPELIDSLELVAVRQQAKLLWQASVFKTIWRDGTAIAFRPDLRINQFQNVQHNQAYGAIASVTWRNEGWQFEVNGAWVTSQNASTGAPYNLYPRRTGNASPPAAYSMAPAVSAWRRAG